MQKFFRFSLALLLSVFALNQSGGVSRAADETLRVAAVVNEDIVSMRDVENRIKLALLYSNLPDNHETRVRVTPVVLRKLIDEHLQIQEASRLDYSVSSNEINQAIEDFLGQNNLTREKFDKILQANNIDFDSFRQEVRTEILWSQVLHYIRVRNVFIGEEEVSNRLETLRANMGKPEYLVSEIFLPVDNLFQENETRVLAKSLTDQLQRGTPFQALSLQFGMAGVSGGNLGWVSDGVLDEELIHGIKNMAVGQASQAIRTSDGFHILYLQNRRMVGDGISLGPTVDLMSIDLTSIPSASRAERMMQLTKLKETVEPARSCDQIVDLVGKVPSASVNIPNNVPIGGLPKNIAAMIENIGIAVLTDPIEIDRKVRRFFAVCGRHSDTVGGLPSRADIRRQIENERLQLEAVHVMRNLQRAANIEIRM